MVLVLVPHEEYFFYNFYYHTNLPETIIMALNKNEQLTHQSVRARLPLKKEVVVVNLRVTDSDNIISGRYHLFLKLFVMFLIVIQSTATRRPSTVLPSTQVVTTGFILLHCDTVPSG